MVSSIFLFLFVIFIAINIELRIGQMGCIMTNFWFIQGDRNALHKHWHWHCLQNTGHQEIQDQEKWNFCNFLAPPEFCDCENLSVSAATASCIGFLL